MAKNILQLVTLLCNGQRLDLNWRVSAANIDAGEIGVTKEKWNKKKGGL